MKTIDELLPEFKEYEKLRGISESFSRTVTYTMKTFKEYLSLNDRDYLRLNIKDAQDYQSYLANRPDENKRKRLSISCINSNVTAISAFYNFLTKTDYILSNPFKYVERIQRERTIPRNLLREKEMSEFLDYIFEFEEEDHLMNQLYRYRAHVVAELMYSTGARIGEIALLKKKDIEFERSMIKITDVKTSKERYGFLNEYTRELLRIYIEEMRQVFKYGSARNEYLFNCDVYGLGTWFNRTLKKYTSDKRFTSHNFRHTVGYHLLRSGCNIRYIQIILGHSRLRSTSIYTKIDKEDLKRILDECHPRQFIKKEKREDETNE